MVPLGLAAAASPVPIITGITLTGGRRPTVSLVAYLLGGLLAYAVLGAVGVGLVSQSSVLGREGNPSTLALSIELVIGVFLVAAVLFILLTRRAASGTPRWMTAVEAFGPARAFLTGIVILSPHVKNLLLLAAAINIVGTAHLGAVSSAIAILVFMAITLSPVLAPLVVYLTRPAEQAAARTGGWKRWLERNNQLILAVVFGVIGLKLITDALAGLLS
jgi:hypothetical protein